MAFQILINFIYLTIIPMLFFWGVNFFKTENIFSAMNKKVFYITNLNFGLNFLLYLPILILLYNNNYIKNIDFFVIPNFVHIIIVIFSHEVISYFAHRILHHPKLFYIHKIHHEYREVKPFVALYTHPIEHVLSSITPVAIPFIFLKIHPIDISISICLILYHAINDHSGDFSNNLMNKCSNNALTHSLHHQYYKGNYSNGFFNFLDKLFKTEIKK